MTSSEKKEILTDKNGRQIKMLNDTFRKDIASPGKTCGY